MPGGYPIGASLYNGISDGLGANTGPSPGQAILSSSYTQIIASSQNDACWVEVVVDNQNSSGNFCTVTIAVGPNGGERLLIDRLKADGTTYGVLAYAFPIQIPAGTRISGQVSDGTNCHAWLRLYEGSFTQMEGAYRVEAIGLNLGTGTSVTPNATAGVLGSYTQLIASTTKDYIGLTVVMDTLNNTTSTLTNYLINIAIGGAGSEVNLLPSITVFNGDAGFEMSQNPYGPIPVKIPAGTRISAQCSANGASKAAIGVTLYGICG